MSYLYIFCRSNSPVLLDDLAKFILEGSFFEEDPHFDPKLDPKKSPDRDWKKLSVTYSSDAKPVLITCHGKDNVFDKIASELLFILDHSRVSAPQQKIQKAIKETAQMVSIEVDREGLSDDAWEMVDSVESYLAKKYDGLIYVPDEGFYDARLKKIYRL